MKDNQRKVVCEMATRICKHVGYECAGTVEFLMDIDTEEFFFIEVNPRIQVEHTITEEVTGIDLGAPVLRYAHARSTKMGYAINYSQQNAEKTDFKNSSFDLVVSTMFLHETSKKAISKIFKETYRILKPGGLMVHVEQPPFRYFDDPYEQFVRDWDTHNNNEPFWGPMHDLDLNKIAYNSGFKKENIFEKMIPLIKPEVKNKFSKGVGEWFIFAGWKL